MERNKVLDVSRGCAVILVILGHVIQYGHFLLGFDFWDNKLFQLIYSFHMPLFMIISGYCFNFSFDNKTIKEILIHRCIPLLYTIFVFTIFSPFFSNGKVLIGGKWIKDLGSIWFLWAIIVSSIPVTIIFKKINSNLGKICCLMLACFFIIIFPNYHLNLYMYPYFIIGFIYARNKNKISDNYTKRLALFCIPFFIILMFFFQKKHFIWTTGIYGNKHSLIEYMFIDLFRYLIGLIGSIAFVKIISLLLNTKRMKAEKLLSDFGQYSLQIYLIQRIIVESWYPNLLKIATTQINKPISQLYYNSCCILLALIFSIIILFISKILTKYFSPILFGKL